MAFVTDQIGSYPLASRARWPRSKDGAEAIPAERKGFDDRGLKQKSRRERGGQMEVSMMVLIEFHNLAPSLQSSDRRQADKAE
jgi:hypothetical protein